MSSQQSDDHFRSKIAGVPISKMRVSPTTQRKINTSKSGRIAAEFDYSLLGYPVVVHDSHNDVFWIQDGQHRIEAIVIDGYLKVIQAFADMRHSGGSASVAIPVIGKLLRFENLSPLTDDPDDWIEVGYGMWQNRRCTRMFSEDGGKTYTDVEDRSKTVHHSQSGEEEVAD